MSKKNKTVENYKKMTVAGKRNFKIFIVTMAVILAFLLFTVIKNATSTNTAGSVNVSGITQQSTQARVDRTERLSTIEDSSYEEQLRQSSQRARETALETGAMFATDVSEYDWGHGANREIQEDFFRDDSGAEIETNSIEPDEQDNRQLTQQDIAAQITAERMASTQRADEARTRNASSRSSGLTPTQERELLDRKMAALNQLVRNQNSTPSGITIEHPQFEPSSRSGNRQQISDRAEQQQARITGGVVPGDRFYGFTRLQINSDFSSWVDVEITSGPLRGAVVGMTPERVDGHVVLMSQSITLGRKTARFRAMALNPDDEMMPAFSTDTNYHRWSRYGAAALAAVTGTVTEMIGRQSSQTQNSTGQLTQSVEFSDRDLILSGVTAGVSQMTSDIAANAARRPPTVTVKQNHRLVLVVTEAQEIPWLSSPLIIERF